MNRDPFKTMQSETRDRAAIAHELTRREVWVQAWVAIAGNMSNGGGMGPTGWADLCLKDFDSRFPAPSSNH